MRAVLQRVKSSQCLIDGKVYSEIGHGLCILAGVEDADTEEDVEYLSKKISKLRIFEDGDGKMNLSLQDVAGEILLVSQFTLFADTKKGNRPSFTAAGKPEHAGNMYERLAESLRAQGLHVKTGVFGADMLIRIENDGPVTILMDTANVR